MENGNDDLRKETKFHVDTFIQSGTDLAVAMRCLIFSEEDLLDTVTDEQMLEIQGVMELIDSVLDDINKALDDDDG